MSNIEEHVKIDDKTQSYKDLDLTMPTVFVLRGLPGTGKTTIAELLSAKLDAVVISSDNYWSESNPFDTKKVNDSYKWSFERYKEYIKVKTPFIVVDQTNIKTFNYKHYVDYAQRNGYIAVIMILPHNHLSENEMSKRSSNKVSQLSIRKLKSAFEWRLE